MGLDEYAQKTRRLSQTTLQVRQAFFMSKSPEKFLLNELPSACGFDHAPDLSGFAEILVGALRELNGAQVALRKLMHRALCAASGLREATPLDELRSLLRGRCHGLDQYTVDVQGLRSFIRRICDPSLGDKEWFEGILLFLGHKPATKWTDQDRDTAEYRLAQFSTRLLELEKLRLHFEVASKQESAHEVILIKTVSSRLGETDEVVSLNSRTDNAIADAKSRIEDVLANIHDQELALALIARLSNDFLVSYRQSTSSRSDTKNAIRKVG